LGTGWSGCGIGCCVTPVSGWNFRVFLPGIFGFGVAGIIEKVITLSMPTTRENKENKALAFTKKKTHKLSFQAKIEKANDLLGSAVFIKKSSTASR